MDLAYIKKLIKMVSESDVDEVEIEEDGKKIRVARSKHPAPTVAPQYPVTFAAPSSQVSTPALVTQTPEPSPSMQTEAQLHEIHSPIVGTFYRSPAPDAAPFVEVGSQIQSGTVLCIVEAMKLMNEIESDVSGKIVKVMVEDGQAVEYGQVMFLVEKS